ncbi:MAG: sigma-70 family RNA polymerase sigma factor [Saprospiraceae bacterium]|nr:sigma-70 family RNA polymerase sigma factor [Saprospiraceae bacterium]
MGRHPHPLHWLQELHKESYLWSLCCCSYNEELAKDVLQDAYLKVGENKAGNFSKTYRKTWFFSIIKYTAIDAMRKRKLYTVPVSEAFNLADDSKGTKEDSEHIDNFKQILEELSTQQREVLTLVFYSNLTINEAAKILKMKVGTARTHYKRGKENFKKRLMRIRSNEVKSNNK